MRAGAQLLQVFESNAEHLGPKQFEVHSLTWSCTGVFLQVFCLPYLVRINQGVKVKVVKEGLAAVPMTVFAKGGHYALKSLAQSGY